MLAGAGRRRGAVAAMAGTALNVRASGLGAGGGRRLLRLLLRRRHHAVVGRGDFLLALGLHGGGLRRLRGLGLGPGIGGFEIDDVAQQHLGFVQLVAPDDDGLEGQRALAQARDHRLAAGLDALGDGDLALAREQLDRAHLAQIHAHRIVGAVGGLLGAGGGDLGGRLLDQLAALLLVVVGLLLGFRPPRTRRR